VAQQIQYLEAQGEITTTFYANYESAYIPHAPEDYTLSPYQPARR